MARLAKANFAAGRGLCTLLVTLAKAARGEWLPNWRGILIFLIRMVELTIEKLCSVRSVIVIVVKESNTLQLYGGGCINAFLSFFLVRLGGVCCFRLDYIAG